MIEQMNQDNICPINYRTYNDSQIKYFLYSNIYFNISYLVKPQTEIQPAI